MLGGIIIWKGGPFYGPCLLPPPSASFRLPPLAPVVCVVSCVPDRSPAYQVSLTRQILQMGPSWSSTYIHYTSVKDPRRAWLQFLPRPASKLFITLHKRPKRLLDCHLHQNLTTMANGSKRQASWMPSIPRLLDRHLVSGLGPEDTKNLQSAGPPIPPKIPAHGGIFIISLFNIASAAREARCVSTE